MYATHSDVSISAREHLIAILQPHLANGINLLTQAKQAQWNVKGSYVLALRELFCGVAETAAHHSDVIAGRIVALGGRASYATSAAAANGALAEVPADIAEGLAYVAFVAEKISLFDKNVRSSVAALAQSGRDAVTEKLLTEILCTNDRLLDILDAHLQAER